MKKDYSNKFDTCNTWDWKKPICKNCIHYDSSDRNVTPRNKPYIVICRCEDIKRRRA